MAVVDVGPVSYRGRRRRLPHVAVGLAAGAAARGLLPFPNSDPTVNRWRSFAAQTTVCDERSPPIPAEHVRRGRQRGDWDGDKSNGELPHGPRRPVAAIPGLAPAAVGVSHVCVMGGGC